MRLYKLDSMTGGWFIGNFAPSIYQTQEFEVAYKTYKAGTEEGLHEHRIATEITLIASGAVIMQGRELFEGDIIVLEPGEATDFRAVTDAATVVVKFPSVKGDKYQALDKLSIIKDFSIEKAL